MLHSFKASLLLLFLFCAFVISEVEVAAAADEIAVADVASEAKFPSTAEGITDAVTFLNVDDSSDVDIPGDSEQGPARGGGASHGSSPPPQNRPPPQQSHQAPPPSRPAPTQTHVQPPPNKPNTGFGGGNPFGGGNYNPPKSFSTVQPRPPTSTPGRGYTPTPTPGWGNGNPKSLPSPGNGYGNPRSTYTPIPTPGNGWGNPNPGKPYTPVPTPGSGWGNNGGGYNNPSPRPPRIPATVTVHEPIPRNPRTSYVPYTTTRFIPYPTQGGNGGYGYGPGGGYDYSPVINLPPINLPPVIINDPLWSIPIPGCSYGAVTTQSPTPIQTDFTSTITNWPDLTVYAGDDGYQTTYTPDPQMVYEVYAFTTTVYVDVISSTRSCWL